MTNVLKRNACAADYKELWQKGVGYPSNDFLCALDPRLNRLNETKLAGEIVAPGTRVGVLTERAAHWMNLRPGIAVAAATIDAYAAGRAAGGYDSVTEAARRMFPAKLVSHKPNAAHHATYQQLYAEYRRLHEYFGRGENDVMKRLRALRHSA